MAKILLRLAWLPPGKIGRKAFKYPEAQALLDQYTEKIAHFTACESVGALPLMAPERDGSTKIWLCDRSPGSKTLSSEELAQQLERCLSSGAKKLEITIGGPDGVNAAQIEQLKPDLRWCFGPMTLPHELAAVVAAEQLYRAFAILKGLPYHSGH